MLQTRRMTVEDAGACAALREEALLASPEAFAVTHEEEAADGDFMGIVQERLLWRHAVTIGVFEDDTLVGTAMLLKNTLQKMEHKADLEGMYITTSFRGRGAGSKLMNALLEQARLWDVEQLQLAVVSSNKQAKSFYESVGFQAFGTESRALKWQGSYWDEEHMVLFL
ncbi:GNAT family N-acetyltransferase [Salibacterium lacus]|uniref:GNAT family N-acetyltransferase n=1 Tax=Salibacterium lacus TaxID=1898109 RepID=A0ABW5T265_9BACI